MNATLARSTAGVRSATKTPTRRHASCAIALTLVAALACSARSHARADAPDAPLELGAPSVLNWITAGALTGITIVTVTSSVYTGMRSGDCVGETEPGTGRCTARVDFGWRSAIFLSVGLASLVAATFFAVLQPIRAAISVGPSHASLQLEARF